MFWLVNKKIIFSYALLSGGLKADTSLHKCTVLPEPTRHICTTVSVYVLDFENQGIFWMKIKHFTKKLILVCLCLCKIIS